MLQELGAVTDSEIPSPLTLSPPSCHEGMVKKLVEQYGGTCMPAQASLKDSDNEVVSGAPATRSHACSIVVLAAISCLLAVM